jgi:hypothetical protein
MAIPSRTNQRFRLPTNADLRPLVPGSRFSDIDANPRNPLWRRRLRTAKFKGRPFYVDQQGRSSGRRVVVFEYPKRDIPFSEDMGRHAIRYQVTGYLIQAPKDPVKNDDANYYYHEMYRDYDLNRDALEAALMSPGPGTLQDPYNPRMSLPGYSTGQTSGTPTNDSWQAYLANLEGTTSPISNIQGGGGGLQFMCERYSIIEQKDKGGFCTIEMSFVEAGIPGNTFTDEFAAAALQMVALDTLKRAGTQLNSDLSDLSNLTQQGLGGSNVQIGTPQVVQ